MNIPVYCPFCGDVLINEYQGVYTIIKSCRKRVTHSLELKCDTNDEKVFQIGIMLPGQPIYWAFWRLWNKELRVVEIPSTNEGAKEVVTALPYFEPDLSDYKALIEKIKTYLIFS